MEKVAAYFRTYEPHTPLAPGLERLINWGRMTVAELMVEHAPSAEAGGDADEDLQTVVEVCMPHQAGFGRLPP